MKLNLASVLKGIVTGAQIIFTMIKSKPANALELLPQIVDGLFKTIDAYYQNGQLSTKEQIDSWFDILDARTGSENGSLDLLGASCSPEDEEFIFDHLIAAGKRYAYRKAGITDGN